VREDTPCLAISLQAFTLVQHELSSPSSASGSRRLETRVQGTLAEHVDGVILLPY
jgi:hypothetical protein